jgi:hypothetical protein
MVGSDRDFVYVFWYGWYKYDITYTSLRFSLQYVYITLIQSEWSKGSRDGGGGPFPTFKHERDLFSGLCAQQTGQNLLYSDATGSAFTHLPPHILYTVKKSYWFSHPQPGCNLQNSLWPGMIKLFLASESLVSDIPVGDGKISNFLVTV